MKELKLLWKITSILILVPLFGLPQYYSPDAKMYVVLAIITVTVLLFGGIYKDDR